MMNDPAIVILTYSRTHSLNRLLQSIANASYSSSNIPLIISIDHSENTEIIDIAENFEWKHGDKKVIRHEEHLGLKKHVFTCGELLKEYDSIILLEDDLVVSPFFYDYASKAGNYYRNDENVAGISLYSYAITESNFCPFVPLNDGNDVYFMQIASSWGQLFLKHQWQQFIEWIEINATNPPENTPAYLADWGSNSWKKYFIYYLIASNRYFVFPKTSYTTNFEDMGVHASSRGLYQVPLQLESHNTAFISSDLSYNKYDAWFEPLPSTLNHYNSVLEEYDYTVDLYGTKTTYETSFVLTTKEGNQPVLSFSGLMQPPAQNIISNIHGNEIHLYPKEQVEKEQVSPTRFYNPVITQLIEKEREKAIHDAEQEPLSIEIVIPITTWNKQTFSITLSSLLNQQYRNLGVVFVCSEKDRLTIENKLNQLETCSFQSSIVISDSNDLSELVATGFDHCKASIVSWINMGTELTDSACQHINSVFKHNGQINCVVGLNNNEAVIDKRWTSFLLNHLAVKKGIFPTSALLFMRLLHLKPILDDLSTNKLNYNTLTLKIIQENTIYLMHISLGTETTWSRDQKESVQQLDLPMNDRHKWLLPIAKYFARTNISYLRSLYFLLFNVPDVLRLDEKNNTFYYSKY